MNRLRCSRIFLEGFKSVALVFAVDFEIMAALALDVNKSQSVVV
jgi:hypothetical protein